MTAAIKSKAQPTPLPVYAVHGDDDYLRRCALREVICEVLGDDADEMACVELDGASATLADVLDECRTYSMMAPHKLVCVRDADEFIAAHREGLERYLEEPSPIASLVLVCRKMAATWRLTKRIGSVGRLIACAAPRPAEIPGWVVRQARDAYGCTVESAAARRLAELIGEDLGRLDVEIAKLATYVAPRTTIREADVEELVGVSRTETVFRITDAIARRDARAALGLWDQMIALDRDAPYRAVGGLAWGFRNLIQTKRLVERGMPVAAAARQSRVFVEPGALARQLDRFTLAQWEDHLLKLLQIDLAAKSGLGDVETAVEKLIVDLAGPAPAAESVRKRVQ